MAKTTVEDFKNNLGSDSENDFGFDFEDDTESDSEEVEDEKTSTKEKRREKGVQRRRSAGAEKRSLKEKTRVVENNYRKRERSDEFPTTKKDNQKVERKKSATKKADEIRKKAGKRKINS